MIWIKAFAYLKNKCKRHAGGGPFLGGLPKMKAINVLAKSKIAIDHDKIIFEIF